MITRCTTVMFRIEKLIFKTALCMSLLLPILVEKNVKNKRILYRACYSVIIVKEKIKSEHLCSFRNLNSHPYSFSKESCVVWGG